MYCTTGHPHYLLLSPEPSFRPSRSVSFNILVIATSFISLANFVLQPLFEVYSTLKLGNGRLLCCVVLRRFLSHPFSAEHLFSHQLQLFQHKSLQLVDPSERWFVVSSLQTRPSRALAKFSTQILSMPLAIVSLTACTEKGSSEPTAMQVSALLSTSIQCTPTYFGKAALAYSFNTAVTFFLPRCRALHLFHSNRNQLSAVRLASTSYS